MIGEFLSLGCSVCPNVVCVCKGYYCCVSTNIGAAVINNGVACILGNACGLLFAVVNLIGNGRSGNCLLCNYKCGCFTLCGVEIIVACKDRLNVVCTCVNERFDFIVAFSIGEILECDRTLCKGLVEACTRCLCGFTVCPTIDNGLGDSDVCLCDGYVNRSGLCKIVCTFSYVVSDNVFACINDCFNYYTVLSDNCLNGQAVGSGCTGNDECFTVVILGVGVVYTANGYVGLRDR